jgi:hypothetical protein
MGQEGSFLVRRMEELTAALNRVKEILSNSSPAERRDRG